VQRAFVDCHGLQCGFCTPAMLLTARWLLDNTPHPTDEEIRTAIAGIVCRCTGYANIVTAIRRAAEAAGDGAGKMRPDARKRMRLQRGRGRFVDDIAMPGMLRRRLRSPALPGSSVDTLAAESHPLVRMVLTGAQLAEHSLAWMPTLSHDVQAVLATDEVRYQGQEVAFVVAETRYAARDALALIDVEYAPLPAVVDARHALDADAPRVRDKPDNHVFDWEAGDAAATAPSPPPGTSRLRPGLPARAPPPGNLRVAAVRR
jgi:hypothetical protein